nr:MAG TPA: hypothetical protein [Caudoviricetes sp.]
MTFFSAFAAITLSSNKTYVLACQALRGSQHFSGFYTAITGCGT